MWWNKNKLFCDIHPICYAISVQKEIFKRHLKNFSSKENFAGTINREKLPDVVFSHNSNMIKRAQGVDLKSQENKVVNIMLSCNKLNGVIIHPGEVFSFWKIVGRSTKKKGFKEGRVISRKKGLTTGIGGGLCNLANTIHLLILHSPLHITEFHNHSDALVPDEGKREPFSTGTSVGYNYIDYRFKNNTDRDVQLCLWCEGEILYAELRSERGFPYSYKLAEENHHFRKEKNKYYRISRIYKETFDNVTGDLLKKELILDNHSEVMYDYALIPEDQIRE